jgi:alanyl-tRNA synthetase
MSPEKAIDKGAIALFGEKYGDEVRVVSIGKSINSNREAWSVELCGGTHVKKTSEISTFKILSETGVSSGVRRIEAVTNLAAINYYNNEIDKIKYISSYVKTNSAQVTKKIEQLVTENQKINKELKLLKNKTNIMNDNSLTKETINGVVFEYKIYNDLVVKELKPNAENFIRNNNSNIVCLISKIDNKASIVIAVEKTFTSKINAVEMVNEVSAVLGGKGGGGRPDMAQSGGSEPQNSLKAIDKLKDYIKNKI